MKLASGVCDECVSERFVSSPQGHGASIQAVGDVMLRRPRSRTTTRPLIVAGASPNQPLGCEAPGAKRPREARPRRKF